METKTKNKIRNWLRSNPKVFLVVFLFLFLLFSPEKNAQAALWPSIDPIIKQNLENIQKRIEGIILGNLKQQAAKKLNSQVSKNVAGKSANSAMFITDWRQYLYKNPETLSKIYMNDYLTRITSGKGSLTGYKKSEGFGGIGGGGGSSSLASLLGSGGNGGNYTAQLVKIGKDATVNAKEPKVTYQGDPSKMFASGNFKNMMIFLSGINDPWTFQANAVQEYQKKKAEEQRIAQTRSVANQAFKSVGEDNLGRGKVKTPGIIVKEKVANTQNIGNNIIANATHPEEVITSVVSQMISQIMKQGMVTAQTMVNQKIKSALAEAMGVNGPAAQYQSQQFSQPNSNRSTESDFSGSTTGTSACP